MELRLTVTVNDTGTVVHADGRLSRLDVAELEGLVRVTTGPITLDLTNLLAADDAGVAVLRSFSDKGVRLVGVSPYMALLLKSERPGDRR
jgi:anti-anti-sigma regulatory factor